ncbi:helicase-related protein [Empedobacter sp. GD03739]|uniref:helicase-related protein n=1 Tax=Empedobacter sp. GD03739 TaxID=2975376 RepID=UPI00244C375E|nr:helicase-related protein [Empedobacter sp. GD03739]MDH1603785.1 helicase-related protein [Empedobacter sp. GD03739]
MKLIDNINTRLIDDLKESIQKKSKVAIAASSFSIYAFEALRKELQGVDELRFVFTSPSFLQENLRKEVPKFFIPHLFKEAELCGGEFELRLRNQLTQRAIAKECSKWVKEKVTFKSNKQTNYTLAGMIHTDNPDHSNFAWTNVNSFTTADLGITPKKGFPTLIQKTEFPNAKAYLDYFNQIWEDEENLEVVTHRVQQYFEKAFQENSPEFIYFITLYNIFNDFLDDLNADNLPDDRVGFKDTVVWNRLFNFQKDAVIGAINKLEKYRGCILADSVGLGKTFSALGVIKYYEMRNKDVLVLCPKKLEANWNTYRHNDKNNILAKDRFNYDVLFHTDLTRESGSSNGRNLANVNWGNYGLVVIDESHNFRNAGLTYSDKENRYQALLRKVMKEGVETKVLMLSATPVNNRFNDLKNQLALAYEGDALNIDDKLDTDHGIDLIFKRAQSAFNTWTKLDISERTAERLLDLLDFDFFEILDSLTIARSRKHITTYYDTSDIGKFPTRNKPVSITCELTNSDVITYEAIAELLSALNLSVYTPLNYILPSKVQFYADKYDKKNKNNTFRQVDRERSLKILMRINLLKRIESSVDSFRITINGILNQINHTIKILSNNDIEAYSGLNFETQDENFDWEANWGEEDKLIGKNVKIHIADLDRRQWKEDLEEDKLVLEQLLLRTKVITPYRDTKLQTLINRIEDKIENPINEGNKKVIIFTAFADTAEYLFENLSVHFKSNFKINAALITGSRRHSTAKSIPNDLNTLLTCFSPISKEKELLFPNINEEIDILIATDCISEGQNLQDCDLLINYDIHWNPVRIIQRFGRIDRIGSINDSITLVNFWPDITLDAYINLKQRVEDRMLITDMASTADDNILKDDQKDLEYRKLQLQKLQDEVTDLEDLREGIDITDLGLNDFRIDLSNFIKSYGEMNDIPDGIHAVVPATEKLKPGVIYVLKNINENININKLNRLHPFYLVYLDENGEVLFNHIDSKKLLDAMRMLCKGIKEPIIDLCEQISKETDEYHNMDEYSQLLKKSINTILETEEEKEVLSLFKAGGTTISKDKFKGIEDFKLVSFLIIK